MTTKRISIAKDGKGFEKDGKPFFYFADTAWSAFTNISLEEWKDYLEVRGSQGFNALQINMLPQWDRSAAGLPAEPFLPDAAGAWDFLKPNPGYFDLAEQFVSLAAGRGMHPALVLLWCDFVPGTWAAKRKLGKMMPAEAVAPYVEYVAKRFRPYAPLYLVSGDTDYPEEAVPFYREALRAVKRTDPEALTTLHSQPGADVPESLASMKELDFYMYQSGHTWDEQYRTWDWAKRFASSTWRKPAVNGEPCYDGHKYGMKQGRFNGLDIRRAFFQSLLCGAQAGFTYGAHGIWSFHHEGDLFPSTEFSGTPYPWRTALGFEGAWDAAYCVELVGEYGLGKLVPLADTSGEVEPWFLAADPGRELFALYLPSAAPATIPLDATAYDCRLFQLGTRRIGRPSFSTTTEGSRLSMPNAEGDVLVIGRIR